MSLLPLPVITITGGTAPYTYLYVLQKLNPQTNQFVNIAQITASPSPSTQQWDLSMYGEGTYRQYVEVTDATGICSVQSEYSLNVIYTYQPVANLYIQKTVTPETVGDDKTVTYTIQVYNAGTDAATNVVVYEQIPTSVTVVQATPSVGVFDTNTNQWLIGTIPAYSFATLTISCVVGTLPPDTIVTNKAEVQATEPNPEGQYQAEVSFITAPYSAGSPHTVIVGDIPSIADVGACSTNNVQYGFEILKDDVVVYEFFADTLQNANAALQQQWEALISGNNQNPPMITYADFQPEPLTYTEIQATLAVINTTNQYELRTQGGVLQAIAPHNQTFSTTQEVNNFVAQQFANNPSVEIVRLYTTQNDEYIDANIAASPSVGTYTIQPLSTPCNGDLGTVLAGEPAKYTITTAIVTYPDGEPVHCDSYSEGYVVTVNGNPHTVSSVGDLLDAYSTEYPQFQWQYHPNFCGVLGTINSPVLPVDNAILDYCSLAQIDASLTFVTDNPSPVTPCDGTLRGITTTISTNGGSGDYELALNTTSQSPSTAPSVGDTNEVLECAGGAGLPVPPTPFPADYNPPTSFINIGSSFVMSSTSFLGGQRSDFGYAIIRDKKCPANAIHMRTYFDEEGLDRSYIQKSIDGGASWSSPILVPITS